MQNATIIDIAINKLIPSKRNVRKSKPNKDADLELLSGIRAEGLLQNLVVIQNAKPGIFEVVAGTRRLKALRELVKQGHFKETDTVPCRFFEDAANAEEISLIENTQRVRMHPADEFEACHKMQKSGSGIETIAAALGIPESTVKKRLKLALVARKIIKAYRDDEIDLEDVMAFTIEDDQARQLEVYEALKESNTLSDYRIREALRGETESSKGKLGKFVGEKAYTNAGGATSSDLFREITYFEDRDLLVDLAIAKLKRAAAKLEGWNWTEISIEHPNTDGMINLSSYDGPTTEALRAQSDEIVTKLSQIEELSKELDNEEWHAQHGEHYERLEDHYTEVEEAIEQSYIYKPEEMALAGCIVCIGEDGKTNTVEGLVRKSEAKALRDLQDPPGKKGSHVSNKPTQSNKDQSTNDESPVMSQSLIDDLTTYRLNIAKRFVAIGGENQARDLLYYTLAMQTFAQPYWNSPLHITIKETRPASSLTKVDNGRAVQELDEYHKNELELDWIKIENRADRYQAFVELELTAKTNLMAFCVAQSLCAGLTELENTSEEELAIASLDIPWHKYFQPTAENYLSRISKPALLELGKQFFTDLQAEGAEKRSKKQLAKELEEILAGKDKTMPASKRAEALDWIPEGFTPL